MFWKFDQPQQNLFYCGHGGKSLAGTAGILQCGNVSDNFAGFCGRSANVVGSSRQTGGRFAGSGQDQLLRLIDVEFFCKPAKFGAGKLGLPYDHVNRFSVRRVGGIAA
jgi:hypothetical protein